jgi:pre-mRNA-splicing factor RBM22/SLT11
MLRRASTHSTLTPPEDQTITSLWIGQLNDSVEEQDLRDQFYAFGEVAHVRVVRKQQIAFVEFTTRQAAEAAATALYNKLVIKGESVSE